jgi:hypothetical protein
MSVTPTGKPRTFSGVTVNLESEEAESCTLGHRLVLSAVLANSGYCAFCRSLGGLLCPTKEGAQICKRNCSHYCSS